MVVANNKSLLPPLLRLLTIAVIVSLITSCAADTKPQNTDLKSTKGIVLSDAPAEDTAVVTGIKEVIPPSQPRPFVNFNAAESTPANTKSIKYFPGQIKVDWQEFISDNLKPKSDSNPSGQDTSNMHFGDFGWNTFISRSPNVLLTDDSSDYYAIALDKLVRLQVDSLEAAITYYKGGMVDYSGNFLAYSSIPLESISFLIQTNVQDISNLINFSPVTEGQILILTENKPYEKYDIILNWKDKKFMGSTDESELIREETRLLEIKGFGSYLITSWMDDGKGQLCDRMFKIYSLEDSGLHLMLSNHYNCDI